MGATNAIAAYRRYAGKVPGLSLAVLVYMALVSKDKDAWPWFTLGQHAIAEHALGRPDPQDADLRAVQRAIGPLIDAEAVTVDRAGAARSDGNTTARYRLNLHEEADRARREWLDTPDGKRRMSNPHKARRDPTVSDGETRRKVTRDPTVSDERPDGNRRAKETRGDKRSEKTKEEVVDLPTASHPLRAKPPGEPAPVIALFPDSANAPNEPAYRVGAPWNRRRDHVQEQLDGAAARRAKAVADHQARLASGETT
jgi:hypothetical protein